MKKTVLLAAVVLAIVTASSVFSAMEGNEGMPGKPMMGGSEMMEHGMMGACPMCMMTGQHMMQKSMVATSDGGVVVMAGGKLMKYDKDLNLVKEVEVKMDMEAMRAKMMKMMESCPMCKKMMPAGKEEGLAK